MPCEEDPAAAMGIISEVRLHERLGETPFCPAQLAQLFFLASWWRRAVVAARNLAVGPCVPLHRRSPPWRFVYDGRLCGWHDYLHTLAVRPPLCMLRSCLAIYGPSELRARLACGSFRDTRPGTAEAGRGAPLYQQPGWKQHGLRLRGGGDTDALPPNLQLDPQLPATGACGFHLLSLNMKGAAMTERQAAGLDHWDCRIRALLSSINLWQRPALIALQELGGGQASLDRLSVELRRLGYDTTARAGEEAHSRQEAPRIAQLAL